MTDQQPPINWAAWAPTREAWIEAHLQPGERLEDFIPPAPIVADRHAVAAAIVSRRAKVRPAWKGLLWAAAGLTLWPLAAFAFSWAALAVLLWCVGWCFWPRPRAKRWQPPRELPPWPGDLAAASFRRRRGEPREGDLYAP
jgi:hypothetical protein